MRIVDQRRTVLHKGTEFKKCCFFTIFGMALSWLLHCVRIAAIVYLYCEYQADLLGTVILLTLLSSGADVGFFFLWKSLITQLSYLLGSYRIDSTKLILHFPLWGEMVCPWEEIACTELCSVYCFRGGRKQKVLRVLLNGYSAEDESCYVFANTGIAQRKKALLFADPMPIQKLLQEHGISVDHRERDV